MPARGSALDALLRGVIDFAGLFPPAGLPMAGAVSAYAAHRRGAEGWMVGRFVVPASRLDELASAVRDGAAGAAGDPWPLAVLAAPGDDLGDTLRRLADWSAAAEGRFVPDAVETRLADADAIAQAARVVRGRVTLYVEIPIADDPVELLAGIARAGARAKVRTGGLTPDAFPGAAQLARFLVRCTALDLPFKATAGLHHPLRGEHRLTYDADAPSGTMFGFLNLFAAAAFARAGVPESELAALLEERDATAFRFTDAALCWRTHALSSSQLAAARARLAIAFGSCSVREPVDDLHQLAFL